MNAGTTRPGTLVAVVGVATEVGKTWTPAQLLVQLRTSGIAAVARKPMQSFDPGELGGTDAEVLAAAGGERPHDVCPAHRWYRLPMAPPMAAEALGLDRIASAAVLGEIAWPVGTTVGLVETVGGVRSPMTHDSDSAGFAALLEPDLTVLVADAGLGIINAVRLALQVLDASRTIVFLNRFDHGDLHRRNREWLEVRDGVTTATDIGAVCEWLIERRTIG